MPEPSPASVKFPFEKKAKKIKVLKFRLPDQVRDTETLMFDPLTQSLWLVSKREEKVRLYELPDFEEDTEGKAIFHQELPITYANGGDISPDGREILIKNYANIYYWPRLPSQTIAEALQRPPLRLPYQEEPQGEAIAWDSQGKGFYTVSEETDGAEAEMLFYAPLKKIAPDANDGSLAPRSPGFFGPTPTN
ncbi:MAG: hypothetical protein HC913_09400 [Microscillaceae bacterium]|nr:hypothetical protein [Microscillaceae bacterium]